MPRVSSINQPFGGYPNRIGDHIVSLLSRSQQPFNTVRMVSAFAKASGISILFDHLEKFIIAGGKAQIAVGINHQGTSRQGLSLLLQSGAEVLVYHNPGSETFHPKFYLFERDGNEGIAIVGSSNLTRGGLYENVEFSVRVDHDLSDPMDAVLFGAFQDAFNMIADLNAGTALRLDSSILSALDQQGYLMDESRPQGGARTIPQVSGGAQPSLFRRVPMPRAPRMPRRGRIITLPAQLGQPIAAFVMTLGQRDTRQRPGYSRDIFIPVSARDSDAAFWDWPGAYSPPASGAGGGYLERRIDLQVTFIAGSTSIVRGVRIYEYAGRDEFRLNCSELVRGASPGDILVVSRMPPGSGYDYEAGVIPQGHPMYNAFRSMCTNRIPQSGKLWGYS